MRRRLPRSRREDPQHLHVGVQQGGDLPLGIFRQDVQAGAQLAQLLAGRGDGHVQPGPLRFDIGGGDAVAGDHGGRFDRAEHRPDGDAGTDR